MRVIAKASEEGVVGWLESGQCMTVLALRVSPDGNGQYLLWSDKNDDAGLFSVSEFEIADGSLSSRWVCSLDESGYLIFGPESWQSDGFWEKYHDGDLLAKQKFNLEKKQMFEEH